MLETPSVIRRVAAHARALVIGNRLRNPLFGDLLGAERFLEIRRVSFDG